MSSLFPLVFAAIYWRRVTRAGAIASVVVSAITWSVFFYDGLVKPILEDAPKGPDYLVFGMMPVALIFAASTAALVVVSLLTSPPPREHVARFFPTGSTGA